MRPLMSQPPGVAGGGTSAAAGGADPEIPNLGRLGPRMDRAAFDTAVRLGKGRMPPAPPMSDGDLRALADYVARIREPAAQAEPPAGAPMPPRPPRARCASRPPGRSSGTAASCRRSSRPGAG